MAARKTRRKQAEPSSQGLSPEQEAAGPLPGELAGLERQVTEAGGADED